MKQTFADGDDPGSYQGNPEVQRETAQMQEQWNKQHGIIKLFARCSNFICKETRSDYI